MTESISKISSLFESAKGIAIEAAVSASSRLADTPTSARPAEIKNLLNSRVERDISKGIKCVIALMSTGEPSVEYFAEIVKNVTSSNAKIRNLVLIYLTRYAEVEPDKSLLAINSIQRLLDDKNPVTRANAIRALLGIRIPSLSQILLLCIKKTVNDRSPLVRSATAIAISKVIEIDESVTKLLVEHLTKLLADPNVQVVGTVIKCYVKCWEHLPSSKRWNPIHGHFRRFCKLIPELDEWSQAVVIDLLTDYCRLFIRKPKLKLNDGGVIELPGEFNEYNGLEYEIEFDKDTQLFIENIKPLVYSDSEFVILSVVRSVLALSTPSTLEEFGVDNVLCSMISGDSQIKLLALQIILLIVIRGSSVFQRHYKKFYIFPSDSTDVARLKLSILSKLVNETNIKYIIDELKYNALNSDPYVARESLKAIGKCSHVSSEWNDRTLKWCLRNVRNTTGIVLDELLTVIRYLIQIRQQIDGSGNEIAQIVYNLSVLLEDNSLGLEPNAKASIIWIIGEFSKQLNNQIAPDVLRNLLKTLPNEPEEVRYQTLILASKLYSIELDEQDEQSLDSIISKMFKHTLTLSKYDTSYETRDRARMMDVLLNQGSENFKLASLFMQVPKPAPIFNSSTSSLENRILVNFFNVPNWADQSLLPSDNIRRETQLIENNVREISSVSSLNLQPVNPSLISSSQLHGVPKVVNTKPTYQLQSLDEFFGSEDSESESEENSESGGESDSEEISSQEESQSGISSEEQSEYESEEASEDDDTKGLMQ